MKCLDNYQIAMELGTNIHCARRMNTTDFGDFLTFHPVQPAGQSSHVPNEITQHQLDKLTLCIQMTFMIYSLLFL